MNFHAVNRAAMSGAVSVMGQSFSIAGVSYCGVINEFAVKQEIDMGGFFVKLTAAVQVAKTAMATAPTIGSVVTIGTKTRRIAAVDEDSISFTLHLQDTNQ